jgi:hypothetical protein
MDYMCKAGTVILDAAACSLGNELGWASRVSALGHAAAGAVGDAGPAAEPPPVADAGADQDVLELKRASSLPRPGVAVNATPGLVFWPLAGSQVGRLEWPPS